MLDLMILSSLHAHSTLPALTHRGPDMMGGGERSRKERCEGGRRRMMWKMDPEVKT